MTEKETIKTDVKSYFKAKHDIDNVSALSIINNIAFITINANSDVFVDVYVRFHSIDFKRKVVIGEINIEDIYRYFKYSSEDIKNDEFDLDHDPFDSHDTSSDC